MSRKRIAPRPALADQPPIVDYAQRHKKEDIAFQSRRIIDILLAFGIVLVVIAILLLMYPRSHPPATLVRCKANLHVIGRLIRSYADATGGNYPSDFADLLARTDADPRCFVCGRTGDTPTTAPTTQAAAANLLSGGHCSYVYCGSGFKTANILSTQVIAYEPLGHHPGGTNFLFGDGHSEFLPVAKATKVISELNAGHNPPRPEAIK